MAWRSSNLGAVGTDHVDFLATGAAQAWGAVATAAVEEAFAGNKNRRRPANLSGRRRARMSAAITVAGVAGWTVAVQYSTDGGTNWAYLDGVSGPRVQIGTTTADTVFGSWVSIVPAARRDVILRAIGVSGNGVATPTVAQLAAEFE
ncbi:MAG: hypothetical protein ABL912_01960 [Novosphingobium sp.]